MNHSTQEYYYDQNEDDRFFAELQKQILILTADDEDDYDISYGSQKIIKSRLRGANYNASKSYFDWTKNEKIYVSNSVPNYILNLWRNGNAAGTGVFIPDIISPLKRTKHRRRKGDRGYIKPMGNQRHNHGQ